MASRNYTQICGVARSLDLIGERWTLLIIRELLLGPKRFGALSETLEGIGPNLLSARLKSLEEGGIVERVELPPPAAVAAYGLTERGEGLREVVEGLALWGFELLDPERDAARGYTTRGSWLAATMAAAHRRRAAVGEEAVELPALAVNCDVDGEHFVIRVRAGRADVRHGAAEDADAELRCTMRDFYELTTGEARAESPAVARLLEALGAGSTAPSSAAR